jgi:hypothetical protein
MQRLLMILSLVYFVGSNTIFGQSLKISDTDYSQAQTAFPELKEQLKADGGRLWNHKLDGPVLLINRETRVIIANEPDLKGELVKYRDYYIGKFPENQNIANSAVDWNGMRWTIVAFPLPESQTGRMSLLIHESFHRIQPAIGFDANHEVQCSHLITEEGRIYLKLELEALKAALASDEPEKHVKNALLFREYRQQLFPDAKNSENFLDINEGLAEYTGTILCGMTREELKKYYISQIDRFYTYPTFVRSFSYFTIPVYGLLMQQADPAWNLKIGKKSNLTDFMMTFYKMEPSTIVKKEIVKFGKSYNIAAITEFEQNREFKRVEQVKQYQARFLGDSIFKIRLENMNIGFSPANLVPLDAYGTVYPNLRITDNWGILEVDSCGALVSSDWQRVTVSYPQVITDTLIKGRGWRLKLNSGWKLEKEAAKCYLIKK